MPLKYGGEYTPRRHIPVFSTRNGHFQQGKIGIVLTIGEPSFIIRLPALLDLFTVKYQLGRTRNRDKQILAGLLIAKIDLLVLLYFLDFRCTRQRKEPEGAIKLRILRHHWTTTQCTIQLNCG